MKVPGILIPMLVLAGPLCLAAQEAAPEGANVEMGESIDVRVVNVEAVVTDRHGQRIKGLSPADFRLLIDGKEVPVDYFTEIRGGSAVETHGDGPSSPVSGAVGRNLLVFIDQSYSVQSQLDLVLRRLQEDLRQIGPGDQVAVVAADPEGNLRVLSDWSSDPTRLTALLDEVRKQPTDGMKLRSALTSIENDRVLRNMADNADVAGESSVLSGFENGHWWDLREARQPRSLSTLENYSAVEREESSLFSDSFGMSVLAAMRAFSSAPGRKVMLLLSGGWPAGAEPRVVEAANLFGYSLYPVDVSGLQTSPVRANADRFGYGDLGSYSDRNTFVTSSLERRVHYGFEVMARETGGKASLNGLREAALERTLEDTEAYYWLGFSPTWNADGKKHDIRLEVRGSGLRVRARRSYSDLSLRAQKALDEQSRKVLAASGSGT